MKRLLSLLAIVAVGLAIVGCGMKEQTGSVTVSFGNEYARNIMPTMPLAVTSYLVTGDGPGSAAFGPTPVTTTTTWSGIVPGTWLISVVGRNSEGTPIAAGSTSALVSIGSTAVANITVTEYDSPNGSLVLNLEWEPDCVDYPLFTGTLTDSASAITTQTFAMDEVNCTAVSTTPDLHPGWFIEVMKLYNAPAGFNGTETLATGFAEAVRIVAGVQTTGTVELHAVQSWGGLEIHFSPDMNDPLVLTPSPAFGSVNLYNGETRTFSCSADRAATFFWYVNGSFVGNGASYPLVADGLLLNESYRLDVVGISTTGEHGGSGTFTVRRIGPNPTLYTVRGTIVAGELSGTNGGAAIYAADKVTRVAFSDLPAGATSFSIPGLAAGSYYLVVWKDDTPHDGLLGAGEEKAWWHATAPENGMTPSFVANIGIPNDGVITYHTPDLW